jgi:uncharacterized membrane protein YedE/YeeE
MEPALVTLGMGLILGYVAQRSRFCLIGGLRDFILVRDTELLKGAVAFFVTAWLAFSVASVFGWVSFQAPRLQETLTSAASSAPPLAAAGALPIPRVNWPLWILTAVAGIALGLFSTLANGCPTRQHVLAAQGIQDSVFYLAGFYLGVIVFYIITKPLIAMFM